MNPQQLSAFFAAHKVAVLGGGAVAVAALGLRARKKGAKSSATAGATIPGTIPAAAVVGNGSSAATYDSTAFDTYDALQQQISDLASRQQTLSPVTPAAATPAPIASSLFAPNFTGKYVSYGTAAGSPIEEVESDGSLYHLNPSEWQQAYSNGQPMIAAHATGTAPTDYNAQSNLLATIKTPTSRQTT